MLKKTFVTFTVVLSFAVLVIPAATRHVLHAQAAGGGGGQGRGGGGGAAAAQGGGRIGTIEDRTAGMQKIDGYFPLYWDERTGIAVPRDPALRHRVPASPPASPPASARTTSASIAAQAAGAASSSFQRVGPQVLLVQPNESFRSTQRQSRRAQVGRGFVRQVDSLGLHGRRAKQRPRAGRRDRLLAARRARRRRRAAAGHLSRRSHAQRVLHAAHEGVSEEHRNRNDADVRQRRRRRTRRRRRRARAGPAADHRRRAAGRGGGGGGRGGGLFSGTVASVTPTAEAVTLREHASLVELPDNNYKPRYDDPRAGYGGLTLRRLQRADRRADADALHPPPSPREEGSERGDQRAGEADSSTGSIPARRKTCRRRWSKARAGGTRRSKPPASATRFKVDVLPDGADPMDIRYNMINWVHRSTRGWSSGGIGRRSAHRRDHQGDGHARIAARSAGLHDLRRPALAVHDRQREAARSCTRPRSSASASSPRTKSATRSASATTTTTATRAGSR